MILPIVAYGDPVLKKKANPISKDYQLLKDLIDDMRETMKRASGVGLAAPQIGLSFNLFITDGSAFDDLEAKNFKEVFINANIINREGDMVGYNEGCLSIPDIREEVKRPDKITIQYYDENFNFHEKEYTGIVARIIQHEYDHIQGILIVDYLSPLKKRILKKRLLDISKGKVDVDYKIRFPGQKVKSKYI